MELLVNCMCTMYIKNLLNYLKFILLQIHRIYSHTKKKKNVHHYTIIKSNNIEI